MDSKTASSVHHRRFFVFDLPLDQHSCHPFPAVKEIKATATISSTH
jgi:hypothetical protein